MEEIIHLHTDKESENVDIGLVFLDKPMENDYLISEPPASTGFMDKMKALLSNKGKTLNSEAPITIIIDEDEKEEKPEKETIIIEDDDVEQMKEEKFISFVEPEEKEETNGNGQPEESFSQLKRKEWRAGKTASEMRREIEIRIKELTSVPIPPVWQNYRKKQSRGEFDSEILYEGMNLASIFQNEIMDYLDFVQPTEAELKMRHYLVKKLQEAVHGLWPEAELYVFGSFETGLFLPSGDIDCVVFMNISKKKNPLMQLAKKIEDENLSQDKIQVIPARVPIVKFIDRLCHVSIDISLNLDTGIRAAEQIKEFLSQYPALRPLNMILKQFLTMRGLNEVFTGGLGSYGLTCMILSFLQLHPKIQRGEIKQEENLGVLLIEFFELYGKRFDYDSVGIRVDNGGGYFQKGRGGHLDNSRPFSLTIQDPQDPSNDITKGTFNMRSIVRAFSRAHDVLTGTFYELFSRPASEEDFYFQTRSILGTILSIGQETISHREYMQEQYMEMKEQIDKEVEQYHSNKQERDLNPTPPDVFMEKWKKTQKEKKKEKKKLRKKRKEKNEEKKKKLKERQQQRKLQKKRKLESSTN